MIWAAASVSVSYTHLEGVALFSGDGGTGFFNYMYNGIVNSSAIEIIAFLMVVGLSLIHIFLYCFPSLLIKCNIIY